MTLQLAWPRAYFILAGQYSSRWDARAQAWWARRCMDALTFQPSRHALYQRPISAEDIEELEDAACALPFGRAVERDIIIPRHDAYVAELKRQFDAGFPIGNDIRQYNQDEVRIVVDWLGSVDERMLGKLWKLSWKQGVEHAPNGMPPLPRLPRTLPPARRT